MKCLKHISPNWMETKMIPKNKDPKIPYPIGLSTSLVNDIKYLKKTSIMKFDQIIGQFLRDQIPTRE